MYPQYILNLESIDNSVYYLIKGIRRKLKNEYIQTIGGIRYKSVIPEE